jgi:hypothetical protein
MSETNVGGPAPLVLLASRGRRHLTVLGVDAADMDDEERAELVAAWHKWVDEQEGGDDGSDV